MIKDILIQNPKKDDYSFIRIIFWIFLIFYSLKFFSFWINKEVMNNYIHWANLIFHEAGHFIFLPFGKFITILWWSIFQCLVPIIVIWVFLFREYNPFWASIWLWWLWENLTDIALYIYDASERSLPLIGWLSKESHDWWNLLTMTGLLDYDFLLGIIVHYIWMLLMIIAILWWFYIHKNAYSKKNIKSI